MNKEVRYLLEDIFHYSSIPVYKMTKDIDSGIWIIFIVQGIDHSYNDEDGNIIEQDRKSDAKGVMVAEVINYKGQKTYLYHDSAKVDHDSQLRIFGTKSKDVAETIATRIRTTIVNENRTVKLVFLEQEKYDRLNQEMAEKVILRKYAKEIAKGNS